MVKKVNKEWDDVTREFMVTVGRNLKRKRIESGKTLVQLADEVGLSQPTLTQIEHGKREFLASYFPRFAKALKVSTQDLIARPN